MLVNKIRFAKKCKPSNDTDFITTYYPSNILIIYDYSKKDQVEWLTGLDDAEVMIRVLNHESLHYVLIKLAGTNKEHADRLNYGLDNIIVHNIAMVFDDAGKYTKSPLFDDFIGI